MAEPHPKSGPFRIHIAYSFDRLLEAKLTQAYEILVPRRERPVGVRVKDLERFLYRLSAPHRDSFVLKGAFLLEVWTGGDFST
jgi:hypothetical protein